MFQKGTKRLKQSDLCIMKCPVITSRLGEQRVRCHPSFIQVTAWKGLGGSGRAGEDQGELGEGPGGLRRTGEDGEGWGGPGRVREGSDGGDGHRHRGLASLQRPREMTVVPELWGVAQQS